MTLITPVDNRNLILDGHKLAWHLDRVKAWEAGERVAPVTIDMALTRACTHKCGFCYAMFQENTGSKITRQVMDQFIDDCAEVGVRAISFAGDGENTLHPAFVSSVIRGGEQGISMALNTNAFPLAGKKIEEVLPHLTYVRVNICAADPQRYAEIMGAKPEWYFTVIDNIRNMVEFKRKKGLNVTIGMQLVLVPEYEDQILPLAKLALDLGVDYYVIKHCSDDEEKSFDLDYLKYERMYKLIKEAESLSTRETAIIAKWKKIQEGNDQRNYQRCYGPPFMIQISGTGLVGPCGQLFNDKFKRYHMGNICERRFKDIVQSDEYWEIVNHLASEDFNAQRVCGALCRPHYVNEVLDQYKKGYVTLEQPAGAVPLHKNFL
ncbi:MAG: radical SAM protein [Bdellovibrionales bacterium]|nr:radical SAM protein [Bdellovibrionales bacterium]